MRQAADRYLLEQRDLMASLQTRGGQLAGFAGVILGLLAPLSERTGQLTGWTCTASRGALVAAAACVVLSAIICLFAVTRPTRVRGITASAETLAWFTDPNLIRAEPWQLEGRTLRFYPEAAAWQEWINKRKAAALFIASVLLAYGLAATAVALGMVVIDG